jgi:hypothetical protein
MLCMLLLPRTPSCMLLRRYRSSGYMLFSVDTVVVVSSVVSSSMLLEVLVVSVASVVVGTSLLRMMMVLVVVVVSPLRYIPHVHTPFVHAYMLVVPLLTWCSARGGALLRSTIQ